MEKYKSLLFFKINKNKIQKCGESHVEEEEVYPNILVVVFNIFSSK